MPTTRPTDGPVDGGQDVMTIDELASYLRIPLSSAYRLAQRGQVPCRKAGKHWRFSRRAVSAWLEASGEGHPAGQPSAQAPAIDRAVSDTPVEG